MKRRMGQVIVTGESTDYQTSSRSQRIFLGIFVIAERKILLQPMLQLIHE